MSQQQEQSVRVSGQEMNIVSFLEVAVHVPADEDDDRSKEDGICLITART